MTEERALTSWLTEQFDDTRAERPFVFSTMITDAEESQTATERQQQAIAYAYDQARRLCNQAMRDSATHHLYVEEANNHFAVIRAALMTQMGPR